MITPAPIAGRQYYKIGDNVTFAWNYTSLSVTPSAIDILASCSLNQNTYTIAANQSVQSSQALVWDTRKEKTGSAPLPMYVYLSFFTAFFLHISSFLIYHDHDLHLSVVYITFSKQ